MGGEVAHRVVVGRVHGIKSLHSTCARGSDQAFHEYRGEALMLPMIVDDHSDFRTAAG
jgi:hypothetical protein